MVNRCVPFVARLIRLAPRQQPASTRPVASCGFSTSPPTWYHPTSRRCQAAAGQEGRVRRKRRGFDPSVEVDHAEFLHEGRDRPDFRPQDQFPAKARPGEIDGTVREAVKDPWVGKLSPTSSHLFKLLLPLPKSLRQSRRESHRPTASLTQTAYLLHPSQPLSHLSRLILGSLPPTERSAEVEFRALSLEDHSAYPAAEDQEESAEAEGNEEVDEEGMGGPLLHERVPGGGAVQEVRWSPSTDLGDFIKQATISQSFRIMLIPADEDALRQPGEREKLAKMSEYDETDSTASVGEADRHKHADEPVSKVPLPSAASGTDIQDATPQAAPEGSLSIKIMIPSFSSRTVYLRKRLLYLTKEIKTQTDLKKELDRVAHKGARRIAVSGLAGLVLYWGVVFKLTFYQENFGWDVMEPVTYLSGLTTVIGGYLFFLYHNREVSYSSILDLSVSARQQKLYGNKGLDVEKWTEMVAEAKTLRKEIQRIAADYDYDWQGQLQNLEATVPRKRADGMPAHPAGQPASQQPAAVPSGQETPDDLDVEGTINEAAELEEEDRELSRGKGGKRGKTEKMTAREEAGTDKGKKLVDENV